MMDRYLILENGMTFRGRAFGANGDVLSEIVFTTAMTGFLETLTDKSYTGQAVVQTFPLIGNYGVIAADAESERVGVSAYIVREWCEHPSNFRCETTVDAFLRSRGIVGLYGIDTRALTRVLREHGVMNGLITDDPARADLDVIRSYRIVSPVDRVSIRERKDYEAPGGRFTVALLDFGLKENILRSLINRGCSVHLLPFDTTAEEILALKPDGLFLSNGPGDPQDNTGVIETLRRLMPAHLPTMGICLGHQLLALANGFSTAKLKYGHRGANQPVKNLQSGRVYISSQNHGYAVVNDSVDRSVAEPWFVNVNDGTNEGLIYKNTPAFSVQFHPEACGGPRDTEFLFDRFLERMEG